MTLMNAIVLAIRRPISGLLVGCFRSGTSVHPRMRAGLSVSPIQIRVTFPRAVSPCINRPAAGGRTLCELLESRQPSRSSRRLFSLSLAACHPQEEESHEAAHKIVVTSPKAKDVIITQQYVCQIHSQRHIEVRALENGYLEEIPVKEGQAVKKGDVMFKIVPDSLQGKAGRRDGRGQARGTGVQ